MTDDAPLQPLERAALLLLAPFALALLAAVARRPSIFVRRHGRAHRLLGAVHLAWLALGLVDVATFAPQRRAARLAHDVALGTLGTALTLAAASAFGEQRGPRKFASGALDESAVVSRDEMLEHAFSQLLNLVQVLYLHALPACGAAVAPRLGLCLLATAPWLARAAFPVHSFSANYATSGPREAGLYRLKKWQYVAYKHAPLHGLNLSAALATAERDSLPQQRFFRLYWQCLNAAYVLEFFMQSRACPVFAGHAVAACLAACLALADAPPVSLLAVVRRKMLRQSHMLAMNSTLMAASSCAALPVLLRVVRPDLALASLALNFAHRGHEVLNTALVAALGVALRLLV